MPPRSGGNLIAAGIASKALADYATVAGAGRQLDTTGPGSHLDEAAVAQVLAVIDAIIWCTLLIGIWMQWAAHSSQPIQDMDPIGLPGSAVFVGDRHTRRTDGLTTFLVGSSTSDVWRRGPDRREDTRRRRQGDRLRPDRRLTTPPRPPPGCGHVDPHARRGRAAHGRG
jgi:hypothetical protein